MCRTVLPSVDKILVSTKCCRRQNTRINKNFASTKCWSMRGSISLLFGPAESTAADLSQTSLMFSYVSQKVLIPPHAVAKSAVAIGRPAFMGRLSPPLYRLIVPAHHAENLTNIHVDKILAPAKISPNYSSLNICSQVSYQKLVKTKSDHHYCPISVLILMTSKLRPSQRSNAEVSECSNGVGPMRGEGEEKGGDAQLSLACQGEGGVWVNKLSICSWLWIIPPPPVTFSLGLSFAFLLAAVRPSLDKILDWLIRTLFFTFWHFGMDPDLRICTSG